MPSSVCSKCSLPNPTPSVPMTRSCSSGSRESFLTLFIVREPKRRLRKFILNQSVPSGSRVNPHHCQIQRTMNFPTGHLQICPFCIFHAPARFYWLRPRQAPYAQRCGLFHRPTSPGSPVVLPQFSNRKESLLRLRC